MRNKRSKRTRQSQMTDWKKAKRARNKAGYVHVSGYADQATAPAIQDKLLTAEEVDKIIEGKGKDDGS